MPVQALGYQSPKPMKYWIYYIEGNSIMDKQQEHFNYVYILTWKGKNRWVLRKSQKVQISDFTIV